MAGELERHLRGLEAGLRVEDIASFPIDSCSPDQTLAAVRAWASPATFNNIPVALDGEVVGVVENVNGDRADAIYPRDESLVRDMMRPLAQEMLVEAREPLRGFVSELPRSP